MTATVRLERFEPVPFAAVRRRTNFPQVPAALIAGLDDVWTFIRARSIAHGHNVAVYRKLAGEDVEMTCGVTVTAPFTGAGEIIFAATPAGLAATAVHVGPYADMGETYDAIAGSAGHQGLAPAGVNWEVYGDWQSDPALLETTLHMLVGKT
ncbi:MAG: GyrI-like domain-containing protein [Hyphomicrobiaceae bacterium]|nr:GyrI-like domain-containing protein [Hyphomicrobiaceae bacterium]